MQQAGAAAARASAPVVHPFVLQLPLSTRAVLLLGAPRVSIRRHHCTQQTRTGRSRLGCRWACRWRRRGCCWPRQLWHRLALTPRNPLRCLCRVKHAQTHAPRSSTYLAQGPNERMHHKILELAVAALARRASAVQEHMSRPRTHEPPDHAPRAMVMRNSAP